MTGGKSGTSSNPMGTPKRPVVRSSMGEEEKRRFLANCRKYGMSGTQWRRLGHWNQ